MRFFFIFCKRQFKHPSFFLLPIALLLLCGLFVRLSPPEEAHARIALYASPKDASSAAVCKKLTDASFPSEENILYTFYIADSEESLREDVATKRAECGFLFPKGLFASVNAGTIREQITIVTAPDSLLQSIASETVFAAWFEEYVLVSLTDYMETIMPDAMPDTLPNAANTPSYPASEMEKLYRMYLENGSVFSFSYENTAEDKPLLIPKSSAASSPTFFSLFFSRLPLLLLFLSCYIGGLTIYADKRSGFYDVIKKRQASCAKCASLLLPLCFSSVILWCAGRLLALASPALLQLFPSRKDILSVGLFSFLFSFATVHFFRSEKSYTACLPALLMAGCVYFSIILR